MSGTSFKRAAGRRGARRVPAMPATAVAALLVAFLATTLAGCGLKGPLYLPAPPPPPATPTPAPAPATASPGAEQPADGTVEPKPPR